MKTLQNFLVAACITSLFSFEKSTSLQSLAAGSQPQLSKNSRNEIRLVFGRNDSIFYSIKTSQNEFSEPVFVGHIPTMHLGAGRGPQIASSANYSVITAIDKQGEIYWYRLDHKKNTWQNMGIINDAKGTAVEGLMSISADDENNFYAAWLDIREKKTNNLAFAKLNAGNKTWSANRLIYRSPDGHVCECCKPSIDAKGSTVAVMFRNWINGSRDLYTITSSNKGKTFDDAQKMGSGTWKLSGCPMDGGGIKIGSNGKINTVWRRENAVYFATPGDNETLLTTGKNCRLDVDGANKIIGFFNDGNVAIMNPENHKVIEIGKGNFLSSIITNGKQVMCVWEQDKKIYYRQVELPA